MWLLALFGSATRGKPPADPYGFHFKTRKMLE
jgi:hypothetical protein